MLDTNDFSQSFKSTKVFPGFPDVVINKMFRESLGKSRIHFSALESDHKSSIVLTKFSCPLGIRLTFMNFALETQARTGDNLRLQIDQK